MMIRFKAPMTYDVYCRRFRLDPDDEASHAKFRSYYMRFKGD